MIKFDKVTKKFNGVKVLNEISFEINKGEVVGFLGPNGAGKTTTMRIMLGLLKADSGQVVIDGLDVAKNSLKIREKIGYLAENNPLYEDFKVWEYLNFISHIRNVEFIPNLQRVVKDCGLSQVLSKKIEHLSRGYKQRVGLAASLIGQPEILVLDEPTIGLDPNQIIEARKLIGALSQEKTVVLSSHILSEVSTICKKVVIIHKGEIVVQGDLAKLTQGKSLEKIFQKLTLE